ISEIKRWFIWLKWLEWNESAGLYTPRSLIRKPKIYTTVEGERNYKEAPCDSPAREAVTRIARYVFCQGFRDLNALTFRSRSLWPPVHGAAFPRPLHFRVLLRITTATSRDTRRGTRAAVRTAGSRSRSRGTRRFSLRSSESRSFRCRDRECTRD